MALIRSEAACDAEMRSDAVAECRLEKQIARATLALASVEAGYYVTDDELDANPTASKVKRDPLKAKWV